MADFCRRAFRGLLLNPSSPQPGELILVYSNSGINGLALEMAIIAREKGLQVFAICAKASSERSIRIYE